MEFVDKLRNVKEQSKQTAQRAVERVRESGASLERHLRQKMRIYPHPANPASNPANPTPKAATIFEEELEETEKVEFQERKPVVSIRGKDVEPAEAKDERRQNEKAGRRIA
jgi:hypothetical protein